jgi:hypothetical protein
VLLGESEWQLPGCCILMTHAASPHPAPRCPVWSHQSVMTLQCHTHTPFQLEESEKTDRVRV